MAAIGARDEPNRFYSSRGTQDSSKIDFKLSLIEFCQSEMEFVTIKNCNQHVFFGNANNVLKLNTLILVSWLQTNVLSK